MMNVGEGKRGMGEYNQILHLGGGGVGWRIRKKSHNRIPKKDWTPGRLGVGW